MFSKWYPHLTSAKLQTTQSILIELLFSHIKMHVTIMKRKLLLQKSSQFDIYSSFFIISELDSIVYLFCEAFNRPCITRSIQKGLYFPLSQCPLFICTVMLYCLVLRRHCAPDKGLLSETFTRLRNL